jgi:GNAT superfamily N-acetyltransferase
VITYQQESLVSFKDDAVPLLKRHWEEIAVNKTKIKYNPDWEAYANLEDAGILKIFTARGAGNSLVGYFACFVKAHIHYKDHLFAYNDVLFLDKDYRKGFTGPKLMKFAERCLKEDGVEVMIVNTKRHKPFDSLLLWLGYTHIENLYSKVL